MTAEDLDEIIALLDKSVALLNDAMTSSPKRQVEIRMESMASFARSTRSGFVTKTKRTGQHSP